MKRWQFARQAGDETGEDIVLFGWRIQRDNDIRHCYSRRLRLHSQADGEAGRAVIPAQCRALGVESVGCVGNLQFR